MIGWWIVIAAQTPEERDAPHSDHKAAVLATWETSVGGIDWVTKLIQEGKATQLSRSGYPNRYTANACDVVPMLVKGIPDHDDMTIIGDDYVMPAGWKGNITMHRDTACPPDQVLTIEFWDQS
jgi:hypothetical protein